MCCSEAQKIACQASISCAGLSISGFKSVIFISPWVLHVSLITEHSQAGEVYRTQPGLALYSHHTIYHLQGKNPMPSAVPAYSKACCCYTGERIRSLSISQTEYRAE